MKRIVICICLLAVVGLLGGCFLEPAEGLYAVPKQIDNEVIRMKLDAMGLHIDSLTPEQEAYLNGK